MNGLYLDEFDDELVLCDNCSWEYDEIGVRLEFQGMTDEPCGVCQ